MFGEGQRNLCLCSRKRSGPLECLRIPWGGGACDNADSDSECDIDTARPRTALELPSVCADSSPARAWAPGCQLF